jgi:hypothetical protein
MTGKKINIGKKPTSKADADSWVDSRSTTGEVEKMKRLTIDIPASIHREIKGKAASQDLTIADIVRKLLVDYLDK